MFILMMLSGNVFEVAFTALTAHMPVENYTIFNALINIFFILTAPLAGIQLMVSKEVSAFHALGQPGKARAYVVHTVKLVLIFALWLASGVMAFSPKLALFLHIKVTPIFILMGVYLCYAPFPVFYGAVQGLKRFFLLGILQFLWGLSRFSAAVIAILIIGGNEETLLFATMAAMAMASFAAYVPARLVFDAPHEKVSTIEYLQASSLMLPTMVTVSLVMILKNIDIILAKHFFDTAGAAAYTCTARVGSGFFVLTGIVMVMFPHVSEEKTLGRNPIGYLIKSLLFTTALSGAGILLALIAPELIMKIITLNGTIPGAPQLIRWVGFAVLPLALTYIMANYLLAKHYAGFLPILFAGVVSQATILWLARATPATFLWGLGSANTVLFVSMLFYVVVEHRQYKKNASGTVEPV
jgi:O-antigen/teichoic acid export membrane protein